MSEAELLELFVMSRSQVDAAIAQTIALNFAMVAAIYYFLHRSGMMLKVGVFILYFIGWFVFVSSASVAGQQMVGVITDLLEIAKAGEASATTHILLKTLNSPYYVAFLIAANAANLLLLVGAFVFLFFWKPPADDSRKRATD